MLIESYEQAEEKGAFQLSGYVSNIMWTADELRKMIGRGCFELTEIPGGRLWVYRTENRNQLYYQADGAQTDNMRPGMLNCYGCVAEIITTSAQQTKREIDRKILQRLGFGRNSTALFMASTRGESIPAHETQALRKATMEDIGGICQIYEESFDPLTDAIPDRKQLADDIAQGRVLVMTRREGERQIIGTAQQQKTNRRTFIRHVAIAPAWRNLGYGKIVMDAIMDGMQPGEKAVLWVKEDNKPAIRLYERLGFQRQDRRIEIWTRN